MFAVHLFEKRVLLLLFLTRDWLWLTSSTTAFASLLLFIFDVPFHRSFIHYFDVDNVFLEVSTITGQYMCGTLLCLAIFLMVVRKVDLEQKKIYYWGFLISAILIPIIVSLSLIKFVSIFEVL